MKKLLVKKVDKGYMIRLYGTDYELVMPVEEAKKVSKVSKPKKRVKSKAKKKAE